MSLQAAGGSAQSTPSLLFPLTHPSLLPSPVLVRGPVPERPHKWLVDLTQGRLRPLLALAGRPGVLKLLAPPFSRSFILVWFNAAGVCVWDGGELLR